MLMTLACRMVFESREHMQLGARLLKGHLLIWLALRWRCIVGWQMLMGRSRSNPRRTRQSTSPPTPHSLAPLLMMTSRLFVWTTTVALSRSPSAFRYLGSILDGSRSDEPEVVHRVQAATAAFARLKQTVFNTDLGNSPLGAPLSH